MHRTSKIKRLLLVLASLIAITVCGLSCLLFAVFGGFIPTYEPVPVITADPNDPDSVAKQFISALVRKDWEMAKAVSAPSIWSRIEHWFETRRILQVCKSIGLNDFDGLGIYGSKKVETPEIILLYSGQYRCYDMNYDLQADEIRLKKSPDGYKVTDWKSLTETYPGNADENLPRFRWEPPPAR